MKNIINKIKPTTRTTIVTLLFVIAFFGLSQILVNSGMAGYSYEGLLIPMCFYIILAVSLNLTVGILGELSLGHAGFMCIGGYVGAVFAMLTENVITSDLLRYLLALVIGGIVAGLFGALIGFSILRLKGDYLAIVTLAFGQITYKILQQCHLIKDCNGLHFSFSEPIDASKIDSASKQVILNGAQTITGVEKYKSLIVAVAILLVTLIVIYNLIDSRAGRAFKAIRDNSIAAESIGINISKYKLIVFFTSAFFAGVAGAMYAHTTSLEASKFDFNLSIMFLVYVVLGGIGKIRGSIIATIILYALPELLRDFATYRMIVYAIILIVMMIVTNNEKCKNFVSSVASKLKFWKKTAKEEN